MEDKQAILDALTEALKITRNQNDLRSLKYYEDQEKDVQIVMVTWQNGATKFINVTMDSGTAMIRDVMKCID